MASDSSHVRPDTSFRFTDLAEKPSPSSYIDRTEKPIALFGTHQLPVLHTSPLPIARESQFWMFAVLFCAMLALSWVRVFYERIIRQMLFAVVNNTAANQIVRDENILLERASLLLTIILYLVAAMSLYLLSNKYEILPDTIGTGFPKFLLILLGVGIAYFLKMVILKLVGLIFRVYKPVTTYIFNLFLINNMLGIILLPIVILVIFLQYDFKVILLQIGIGFSAIAYIFRLGRGVIAASGRIGFSSLYLFLYLCALEIGPLLILWGIFRVK